MSKTDLLYSLSKQNDSNLTSAEKMLLEISLLTRIYQELSKIFNSRYQEFQSLTKCNFNQEEPVFNGKFMQEIIRDILSTDEYTIPGMALHTHIPEEVLSDVAIGMNTNPTLEVSRKIFELHIAVRPKLYDKLMRKIALNYLEGKGHEKNSSLA